MRRALDDLEASNIDVPSLEADFLIRGHAVHFRCRRRDPSARHALLIDLLARDRPTAILLDYTDIRWFCHRSSVLCQQDLM